MNDAAALTRHSAWMGPCVRPSARHAAVDRVVHRALHRRRRARRRHVDRLLEERTVERIGLVEDRQHLQRAVDEHALDGVLLAGDERLRPGSRACVGIAQRAHVRSDRAPAARARQRPPARAGVVGPYHAAARRTATTGLTTQGHGESQPRGRSVPGVERRANHGTGRPGIAETLARRAPCDGWPRHRRRSATARRIASAARAASTAGPIADGEHAVDRRCCAKRLLQRVAARRRLVKPHGDRVIAPGIVELTSQRSVASRSSTPSLRGRVVEGIRI